MKSDIFTNLKTPSWVVPMELKVEKGITWLVPDVSKYDKASGRDESMWINAISIANDLTVSFLKLGKLMYESISIETYKPLYYDDAVIDCIQGHKAGFLPPLHDENCPFLGGSNGEAITQAILEFVNKYGMIKNDDPHAGHIAAQPIIESLSKTVFGKMLWRYKAPVSWLAYCFFELYLMCTKPEEYGKARLRIPGKYIHIAGEPSIKGAVTTRISVELKLIYQHGRWQEEKVIDSILGLIILMLQYNEDIITRECPNCGAYFTTSNEKAVYCSPVCRNQANAKKSYYRKKERDTNA